LFRCGAQGEIGLRADEIDHGLRLRQVHLPVMKCAFGKFSRFCRARAGVQTGFEHARTYQRATVTTNLNQILARVTRRRAMY